MFNIPQHYISLCAITRKSEQGVMLAVGEVSSTRTLSVAYRGTTTWKDTIADADIELSESNIIPGGRFHSRFSRRSDTVTTEQILHCADVENCLAIVTCGHSLGGAVSSIAAIYLMKYVGASSESPRSTILTDVIF